MDPTCEMGYQPLTMFMDWPRRSTLSATPILVPQMICTHWTVQSSIRFTQVKVTEDIIYDCLLKYACCTVRRTSWSLPWPRYDRLDNTNWRAWMINPHTSPRDLLARYFKMPNGAGVHWYGRRKWVTNPSMPKNVTSSLTKLHNQRQRAYSTWSSGLCKLHLDLQRK